MANWSAWSGRSSPNTASQAAGGATLIPLPTASAILNASPGASANGKSGRTQPTDDKDDLERLDQALQRHMQTLLDAQSNALFAGKAGPGHVDSSDDNDNAASLHMRASQIRAVPVRQRAQGLQRVQDIREGIRGNMLKLIDLKSQQADRTLEDTLLIQDIVARLREWDEKERKLNVELDSVSFNGRSDEAQQMQIEDDSLQEQVNAMEQKLSELRLIQRKVRLQRSKLENVLQSSASSYKASLAMLLKDRSEFLNHPSSDFIRALRISDEPFFEPSRGRRTAAQALDALNDAESVQLTRRNEAKMEAKALRAGLELWQNVLDQVMRVEQSIKAGLVGITSETSDPSRKDEDIGALLQTLDAAIKSLRDAMTTSETQGWSLLICCVGAELEALRRGQSILRGTLSSLHADSADCHSTQEEPSPVTTSRSLGIKREKQDLDCEPDPESLLLSTNDTDTD